MERGKLIGDQRILTKAVDEWLVAALLCAMMMAMRRLHRAENFDLYHTDEVRLQPKSISDPWHSETSPKTVKMSMYILDSPSLSLHMIICFHAEILAPVCLLVPRLEMT